MSVADIAEKAVSTAVDAVARVAELRATVQAQTENIRSHEARTADQLRTLEMRLNQRMADADARLRELESRMSKLEGRVETVLGEAAAMMFHKPVLEEMRTVAKEVRSAADEIRARGPHPIGDAPTLPMPRAE